MNSGLKSPPECVIIKSDGDFMYSIELMDDKSEKLKYNAGALPIKSAFSKRGDYPAAAVLSHWHTDIEFSYVTKGSLLYNVNGEVTELSAGQMIFVNSGQMHFGFWDKPCECEFICTIIHPSLMHNAELFLKAIFGKNSPPQLIFDVERLSETPLFNAVSDINRIVSEQTDGFELMLLSRVYELAFLLYQRISVCREEGTSNKKLETVRRMTGFITQNYPSKITLADIAAAGNVCRSECCKIFREFLGRTPVEYLNEYRISKGADMLLSSENNVTEIAAACGFSSSSYFAECFLRVMKCTPSEYRKN